jgi:hypothetical protein
MLDVNTAPEGNVERFFTPYDHDVNLQVFRTLPYTMCSAGDRDLRERR